MASTDLPKEGLVKRIIAFFSAVCLLCCACVSSEKDRHIVLPNPRLLRCRASECSQLWPNGASTDAIYPRQIVVDIFGDNPCPLGLEAIYEKSVSKDDLKVAIDKEYGQWGQPGNASSPAKLWRVEPEQFAIQLAVTEDRTKKATREERSGEAIARAVDPRKRSNIAEGGLAQVIYIAFTNKACSSQVERR